MKSIATLLGWIALGAIVTIAGQHVWKQFKNDNPQRSEEISQNVKKTIQQGAESIKETAEAVVEKTKPEVSEPESVTAASESPKTIEPVESTVAKVGSESQTKETPAFPSLGPAAPIDSTAGTRTPAERKEDAITERFYRLAEDTPVTAATPVAGETIEESAESYQERQEILSRQEDLLLERQMRIVDELAAE